MTNPNLDKRKVRVNRLKHDGHCHGCGRAVYIWFAVSYCDSCLGEMTESHTDLRHNKPSLVRYYR